MKKISFIAFACFALYSCGNPNDKKIVGKWYSVDQELPSLDSILKADMYFLDTVGKSTTPEQNEILYGTRNLDSLIKEERLAIDSLVREQKSYMKQTRLEFRKDGVVISETDETDSANWYFDDEGALIFDEMKLKGAGDKIRMEVVSLSDTLLELRLNEDGFTGTMVFHPDKQGK